MKNLRIAAVALGILLASAGAAVASDNELGPVWNPPGQMVLFMVHCYSGPCDEIEIDIFDKNGNTVQSASFDDVPEHGAVYVAYTGPANPISANWSDTGGSGEATVVILDSRTGKVTAITESN